MCAIVYRSPLPMKYISTQGLTTKEANIGVNISGVGDRCYLVEESRSHIAVTNGEADTFTITLRSKNKAYKDVTILVPVNRTMVFGPITRPYISEPGSYLDLDYAGNTPPGPGAGPSQIAVSTLVRTEEELGGARNSIVPLSYANLEGVKGSNIPLSQNSLDGDVIYNAAPGRVVLRIHNNGSVQFTVTLSDFRKKALIGSNYLPKSVAISPGQILLWGPVAREYISPGLRAIVLNYSGAQQADYDASTISAVFLSRRGI